MRARIVRLAVAFLLAGTLVTQAAESVVEVTATGEEKVVQADGEGAAETTTLKENQTDADKAKEDDNEVRWRLKGTPLSRTSGAVDEFWHYLQCDKIFSTVRPVHNESTWMLLRGAYQAVVGAKKSSVAPLSYGNGFAVDIYVGQSIGAGRGVFAATNIDDEQLVWDPKGFTAEFYSGEEYRQFLLSIPVDLACDAAQWCYCEDVKRPGSSASELAICCDLDEGSFMNMGDDEDDVNVGCPPRIAKKYEVEGGCNGRIFALRDIEAGEELRVDYGEFAVSAGWEDFDM